jgi:hypothetical protein
MKSSYWKFVFAVAIVAIGVGIAAAGIYIGDTDDAPGAALIGILIALGMLGIAVRMVRRETASR